MRSPQLNKSSRPKFAYLHRQCGRGTRQDQCLLARLQHRGAERHRALPVACFGEHRCGTIPSIDFCHHQHPSHTQLGGGSLGAISQSCIRVQHPQGSVKQTRIPQLSTRRYPRTCPAVRQPRLLQPPSRKGIFPVWARRWHVLHSRQLFC